MLKVSGFVRNYKIQEDTESGMKFIVGELEVPRDSGYKDIIPFRSHCIDVFFFTLEEAVKNTFAVYMEGSVRNYATGGTPRYRVSLFADKIEYRDPALPFINEYTANAKILSMSDKVRRTPSGTRILDVNLLVQRRQDTWDKIPCIIWNKTAEVFYNICKPEDFVSITGRLQFREYTKDGVSYGVNELSVLHFEKEE